MDKLDLVIEEIDGKFGEWLDMSHDSERLRLRLMAQLLIVEREKRAYYEKLYKNRVGAGVS